MNDGQTTIFVDDGDLAGQADQTWAAILNSENGAVAELNAARGSYQERVSALVGAMSRCARFARTAPESGATVPVNPPRAVAEVLLARPHVACMVSTDSMRLPDDCDTSLTALLAEPPPEQRYAVDQILGVGHNGTLAGAYKAGKTSTACDLTRCLADGEPFVGLDTRLEGNVGWLSAEMAAADWREYMSALGVRRTDRVHAWHLRGYQLPLMNDNAAERAVEWLREREVGFWVVDSHARLCAWSRVSENSNDDVAALLTRLDVIKAEAGVRELLHVCHFGRSPDAERARGATVLDDWPDARWVQTKDDDGNRFIGVEGRGVELPQVHVQRDGRGRLQRTGLTRTEARRDVRVDRVVEVVTAKPGIKKAELLREVGGAQNDASVAVTAALLEKKVHVVKEGNASCHHLGPAPAERSRDAAPY